MKKILIGLIAVAGFSMSSCDKDSEGLNYDFSNSLPPYVGVAVDEPAVVEGDDATFTIEVRTALQEPVTVTYDVSGDITETGKTIDIPKGETSVTLPLATTGVIPSGAEEATATVTLKSATSPSGIQFRLGSSNDGSPQTADVVITKE